MNRLMNSSMLGLAPIAPTQTLISEQDEERAANEMDEICPPVIERMATDEEIAHIREELQTRDAGTSKHEHWCSVLLRATWRRVQVVDPGGKNRRW